MCDECKRQSAYYEGKIATLMDALKVGTDAGDGYDYSEPFSVGGLSGNYTLRAPFVGDCEFSVVTVAAGASVGQLLVTTSQRQSDVDFTSSQFAEGGELIGYIFRLLNNTSIPVTSPFSPVRNGENTLYIHVGMTAGNTAYVGIVFRQKRK